MSSELYGLPLTVTINLTDVFIQTNTPTTVSREKNWFLSCNTLGKSAKGAVGYPPFLLRNLLFGQPLAVKAPRGEGGVCVAFLKKKSIFSETI